MTLSTRADIGIVLVAVYHLLRIKLETGVYAGSRWTTCRGCRSRIAPGRETVVIRSGDDRYGRFCNAACCESYFIQFLRDVGLMAAFAPVSQPVKSETESTTPASSNHTATPDA